MSNQLPPITEEDMPAVKKMIERLIRMRKREVMHRPGYSPKKEELDTAIAALCEYGYWHDWWKKQETDSYWG